jgi:hypothetical protein
MLDMEVVKKLLHSGVSELAAVVTLEYLGGITVLLVGESQVVSDFSLLRSIHQTLVEELKH